MGGGDGTWPRLVGLVQRAAAMGAQREPSAASTSRKEIEQPARRGKLENVMIRDADMDRLLAKLTALNGFEFYRVYR